METDYRSGGFGYGDFKKRLFGAWWEYFAPMRARRAEIQGESGYINRVLSDGAEKARAVASDTMDRIRRAVGLR
jgi:tryptophanyl-tRNA synthetase